MEEIGGIPLGGTHSKQERKEARPHPRKERVRLEILQLKLPLLDSLSYRGGLLSGIGFHRFALK